MRKILFATFILLVVATICFAEGKTQKAEPNHISVEELLDKYDRNADRFHSFRIKAELSVDVKLSGGIGKPPAYLNGESGRLCDVRFDGQRISSRVFMWGNLSPRGPIPKGKPAYKSFLWDGKDYWRYSRAEDPLGKVVINRKQSEYEIKRLQYGHAFSGMIGYFSGSTERFDSVILKARTASVREETEQVNGVDCFVIDADTKHGNYSVWIDPTHGYSIAKAQVRMKHDENHFYYGIPFNKAGRELYWTINNLQFEEIDGVWIPVEATKEYHRLYSYQGDSSRSQTHTKVTEILMNPDHDALGSFIPDDIPDGAKVDIVQVPSIQYTWQDGKVIDKDGKVIMDCIAENDLSKEATKNKTASAAITVSDLLDRFAATQNCLQSFIYKSKASYESHNSLPAYKKISGKKTEFYELRYDGDRTSARYQKWGNVGGIYFTKEDPAYVSWLWDSENYIKYSTPDKGRDLGIVVIERDRNNIRNKDIISSVPDSALMGFFYGDDDRIDLVLRKADKISVRHEMDIINNSKCYVIDAIGRGGKYTIWIDPEHEYHIAKARIRRQRNNLMYGRPMQQEEKQSTLMENVRFEKVGDMWVPVEADRKTDRILGRGHFDKWKLHTVRTEMILNPDHDALGSFLPDDIENGAMVYITAGISNIKYRWQDGKVIDKAGKVIMDCIPKKQDTTTEPKQKQTQENNGREK